MHCLPVTRVELCFEDRGGKAEFVLTFSREHIPQANIPISWWAQQFPTTSAPANNNDDICDVETWDDRLSGHDKVCMELSGQCIKIKFL